MTGASINRPRWTGIAATLCVLACSMDVDDRADTASVILGPDLRLVEDIRIRGAFGRISDVEVSSDGVVFVADPVERKIHCYDPTGHAIGVLGGKGQGPGEFGYLTDMAVSEERLLAFDGGAQRVTSFPVDGCRRPLGELVPQIETFVVRSGVRSAVHEVNAAPGGDVFVQLALPVVDYEEVADEAPLILRRFGPDGASLQDSVLAVPPDEWLVTASGGGYTVSLMPFGRRSLTRVGYDGRVYHLWTGSKRIQQYSLDGTPTTGVALPLGPPRSRTTEDLSIMRASIVDNAGFFAAIEGDRFDSAVEQGLLPDTLPVASEFAVDEEGRLWLTPVTESRRAVSMSFGMVFRSSRAETRVVMIDSGAGTARWATVPIDGRLEAARGDRVFFVAWDSLDVESLVSFKIVENDDEQAR